MTHPTPNPRKRSRTSGEPSLRLVEVGKRFGDVVAVDGVSLEIDRGEFFALLGPSGCGKSTLLRLLAGFETPDTGRIEIDGRDMSAVPPYRRPVNMMFQSYALFPHMTVAQNIAFGLNQEGLPRAEVATRVREGMALVQLSGMEKRKPHQLSGGQRQRVALARSLVKRPRLLLLDEPLGALDKKLRDRTQFELVNIQEQTGITFVIVTHDQEEAMTVADRLAIMKDGRIEQMGTPAEVYEFPRSRYVADFIGEINLFEGRLLETSADGSTIEAVTGGGRMTTDRRTEAAPGATVWYALRPEKISISHDAPPDPAVNSLSGIVWDIAYLGDVSIYHVRLESGQIVKATRANATRVAERDITWDERIFLHWNARAGLLLDR